ncbi:MAG: RecQ family ATP-dependent DNA helicase [Bacteroidia bacterium]|nr:RecQ family ATP-dependent DNA helicase [Bacteroidia bacterium]
MTKQQDIFFYLKKHWGYDSFRPLQQDIIESVLSSKDTLALLPTGGGKSICFQIPGLVIGGTCLVISPLIALMNDQVQNLKSKGISAVAITSSMNAKEIDIALNNAAFGHVQFLYVSPERVENETFRQRLSYLPIGLIAIDEAHCISQWGYDFRPSYIKIAELREYFPNVNVIAVTASATKEVVEDIQLKLNFKNQSVFRQSFERKNIRYVVQLEENKYERLLKVVHNIGGSGIIYVRNRKKTEEICKWLIQNKISASFYHAGINANDRALVQQNWIDNKSQVMVATNAFGMGIDKPDVRFVVHLDLPESLEAYFQEAGRGGRDEKTAYAVLLCNNNDVVNLKEQYEKKTPTVEEIKQCYQAIFNFYQVPVESGEGLSVSFDMDEVARNYNLKPVTLFNAIKCLEKEGYFSFLDSGFEPPKVMMVMKKDDLYNFQIKFPKYEPLLKVLLRSYGGLYEQYSIIKEKDVAFRAKISEHELNSQLDILNKQGVISFLPQTSLPKLIFLQNRINLKFESIRLINYPILKEKALTRINSVVNYVTEKNICRSRLLLSYFNETDFNDCQFCDVCIEKYKRNLETDEGLIENIKIELTHQSLSLQELISKFQSVNSKRLNNLINKLIDDDVLLIDSNKNIQIK